MEERDGEGESGLIDVLRKKSKISALMNMSDLLSQEDVVTVA
jgi:hypothetical protein